MKKILSVFLLLIFAACGRGQEVESIGLGLGYLLGTDNEAASAPAYAAGHEYISAEILVMS